MLAVGPEFEAEIAGVAGARDADRDAAQVDARHAEVLERRRAERLEYRPGGWALQRKGGDTVRDVADVDLQADGVVLQPAQVGFGGRHAEELLVEASDGAIVDHLAGVIAPGRIEHLADTRLEHVAGDDEVEEPRGIAAPHQVLVERRDVKQRRCRADHVVFALVRQLVGAGDDVACPTPPGMARAERRGALVERRGLQHQLSRAPLAASK